MKKSLMYSLLGCCAVANSAEAFEVTASGQVSRMAVAPDDAEGDEVQFQDIGFSGSRFRFTGTQPLGDFKVGFRYEIQLQSNPSFSATGGGQTDGGNDDSLDNRIQDIWFSGSFGKIALGKGDGASNGSTEADLSGTALTRTIHEMASISRRDLFSQCLVFKYQVFLHRILIDICKRKNLLGARSCGIKDQVRCRRFHE